MKPFEKPIFVTRPFLPPIEAFCDALREIWDSQWLTNEGPILNRFTRRLASYLKIDNLCLFNNGTLALQIALQGMEISGEVITTPFTFAATTHALFWNRARPVFVDIEPDFYTIDPDKVEAAITPWTTAILAVHVYGHVCKLDALAEIARRYNLTLIYDAAHAFGVKVGQNQIGHFGDVSMFSFHATKPYHSIEGGMLVFRDQRLKDRFDYLKNFGFESEVEVVMPGTNAKMNEFQALMGEMVLDHLDQVISARKKIYEKYRELLENVPGINLAPQIPGDITYNYAYMPVEIVDSDIGRSRDDVYEQLKRYNIFSRRYFYPLVCDYPCYRSVSITDPLIVARRVAARILCLPIYESLEVADVEKICEIIRLLQEGRISFLRDNTLSAIAESPGSVRERLRIG